MRTLLVLLLVALPAGIAAQGVAGDDAAARETARLNATLMSPFCPGLTLGSCPSPDAATLREEISVRLRRGEPSTAIVADLEGRFGDVLDGAPRRQGVGWLAWLLPFPLGLGLLAVLRASSGRPATRAPDDDATPTDADLARLDDELDALS